jgi:hypothetical protein
MFQLLLKAEIIEITDRNNYDCGHLHTYVVFFLPSFFTILTNELYPSKIITIYIYCRTAPEVFERCVYTKFSDTWSYGVVCVETFQDCSPPAYNVPFDQLKQKKDTYLRNLYGAILKGLRMPKPAQCPQTIYNEVIVKCWQKEYKDRMHYREIIEILSR